MTSLRAFRGAPLRRRLPLRQVCPWVMSRKEARTLAHAWSSQPVYRQRLVAESSQWYHELLTFTCGAASNEGNSIPLRKRGMLADKGEEVLR